MERRIGDDEFTEGEDFLVVERPNWFAIKCRSDGKIATFTLLRVAEMACNQLIADHLLRHGFFWSEDTQCTAAT